MTIIFSAATSSVIIMTVDSAVTNTFTDGNQYEVGIKHFDYNGVGCVATWGQRVGNNIERFLGSKNISPEKHAVNDLAQFVIEFLIDEYSAHDPASDDIGYHVAGFDKAGKAQLYHIFWGLPRPNVNQQLPNYDLIDHSPTQNQPLQLLYNGRNDIAHTVVQLLIQEIQAGQDVGFDIATPIGLVCFSSFVARLAGELTPVVGPPFDTIIISPQNQLEVIRNNDFHPLSDQSVSQVIKQLRIDQRIPFVSLLTSNTQAEGGLPPFTAPSGVSIQSSGQDITLPAGTTHTLFAPNEQNTNNSGTISSLTNLLRQTSES